MAIDKVQSRQAYGNWKHDTHPISFTLCVDDFGVKYVGREHAEHLKNVLNENYKCAVNWDGKKNLGMDIDWDYDSLKVHVSMLDYIPEALARFLLGGDVWRRPIRWIIAGKSIKRFGNCGPWKGPHVCWHDT